MFDTPSDKYRNYREKRMMMCASVSQIGKPCVLCGCAEPSQFENLEKRKLFSNIYYAVIVCDNKILENKLKNGRKITDDTYIENSLKFNEWLKNNANQTQPKMQMIDNSNLTPEQTADAIHQWIKLKMN